MKKLLYIAFSILFAVLLSSCGSRYEYKENDFEFTVAVSKTSAKLGDVIEVTARLKNVSGKNIKMLMADGCWYRLEEMIQIGCAPGFANSLYGHHDDFPRYKLTFNNNQELVKSATFEIDRLEDYEAMALAGFLYGKRFSKGINFKSNVIKITVNKETNL